jgi:hypothetical protein
MKWLKEINWLWIMVLVVNTAMWVAIIKVFKVAATVIFN